MIRFFGRKSTTIHAEGEEKDLLFAFLARRPVLGRGGGGGVWSMWLLLRPLFAPQFMNPLFAHTLLAWYARHGRDLPWRHTTDPYAIWISETILQQTRVNQGADYYARFMARFPTVEALAQASEDEVLLLWQGLGYYSRARNLHAAAAQVVEMGGFPHTYEQVLSLRGVGQYTAAAICSLAYSQPVAVVDGNVYRVLARYLGVEEPIDTTSGQRLFRVLAQEMMDEAHPSQYNQAVMDFGAMVCMPKGPACHSCPLALGCEALRQGMVGSLPRKSRRATVRDRYFTYLLLHHPTAGFYLERRGRGDIWQGLYQPYLHESDGALTAIEAAHLLPQCQVERSVCGVEHRLTHQRLHADAHLMHTTMAPATLPGLWVPAERLADYAKPRLVEVLLQRIL